MTKLSPDLEVACMIYKYNEVISQPIWFGKLVELFKGTFEKNQVSNSLDVLTDWGIVYGRYGETISGRAGYLYLIDEDHKQTIKELYETYYKNK